MPTILTTILTSASVLFRTKTLYIYIALACAVGIYIFSLKNEIISLTEEVATYKNELTIANANNMTLEASKLRAELSLDKEKENVNILVKELEEANAKYNSFVLNNQQTRELSIQENQKLQESIRNLKEQAEKLKYNTAKDNNKVKNLDEIKDKEQAIDILFNYKNF